MIDVAQHESLTTAAPVETCPVLMRDEKPCGRPALGPLSDGTSYCLMHRPAVKDDDAFQEEFERILNEAGTGVADFTRFVFSHANYKQRVFRARCVFVEATFTQDASFTGATFIQGAEFIRATFTQNANFVMTTFTQDANFTGATFIQNTNFVGAKFIRNTNFFGARFTRDAVFSVATFTQDASFSWARFSQDAAFSGATFTQNANFAWTTFTQNANFVSTTFTQNANFNKTTFTQNVSFARTTFTQTVYFAEAKFLGTAEFRETEFRRDEGLLPGPAFSLAEFSRPEAIIFHKTYLGQALLHNCDVSKLNFSSVEWRKRKSRGKSTDKRMVFEEEVDLKAAEDLKPGKHSFDERDYSLVAGLYQQLKKNYDERKDYWTAGHFHYGEMEMKRLSGRWRNFGLVAWYKYASQYGESYMRPVGVLLIVLGLFTLLFPWAGLKLNESPPHSVASLGTRPTPPATTADELSYKHFADFVGAYPAKKWVGGAAFFGNSFMTTLSVAGFQKELKYEPSYPWGRVLALLELLLTSTLIALFLLALRRQFKR
jgi:hypothetical protein